MKKLFTITAILLLFAVSSCSGDDNFAKVKVINETDVIHDFYDGFNSNSNYLGQVGANQIETFEINLGDIVESHGYTLYAEPIEGGSGQQFVVTLNSSETVTLIID